MKFELSPYALPSGYGDGIIPIADAKAHLYVEHDDDDALIGIMRDAAIDMTEKYVQVKLAAIEGLKWRAERLCSPLKLGVREVRAIEVIDYLDSDGVAATMDVADVRIGLHGEILPAVGAVWPSDVGGGVEITFTAGFEDGMIPPCLIAATKLFLGHLYANREEVIMGATAVEIPMGFQMLCAQYRIPVI